MHLLTQALKWVRTVTLGWGTPSMHERAGRESGLDATPRQVRQPSSREWGRILHRARQRRAPHLWPPGRPQRRTEFDIGLLIRAYVLSPDERRSALIGEAQP
jgi:hypothetical protein